MLITTLLIRILFAWFVPRILTSGHLGSQGEDTGTPKIRKRREKSQEGSKEEATYPNREWELK